MKILLTNDDGIYAKGLWAIYKQFVTSHHVIVVAPDRERSAVGHGITLHEPLRASDISINGYRGYAVNGTPADCIKLGLSELAETMPDLVISGINPGANVGGDVNYSGTVAAAKEAALSGFPAIAVSIRGYEGRHYDDAAIFVKKLAQYILEKGLPFGTFLNVNIPDLPAEKIAGIRFSRQDVTRVSDYFERRIDPRNRPYHWLKSIAPLFEDNPDTDGTVLSQDYISVTPLKCDMTDYSLLKSLREWNFDF